MLKRKVQENNKKLRHKGSNKMKTCAKLNKRESRKRRKKLRGVLRRRNKSRLNKLKDRRKKIKKRKRKRTKRLKKRLRS